MLKKKPTVAELRKDPLLFIRTFVDPNYKPTKAQIAIMEKMVGYGTKRVTVAEFRSRGRQFKPSMFKKDQLVYIQGIHEARVVSEQDLTVTCKVLTGCPYRHDNPENIYTYDKALVKTAPSNKITAYGKMEPKPL
jgi:hypothetical protein